MTSRFISIVCSATLTLSCRSVACACEPAIDYHGMFGGLFPTFSGQQTQDKLFASAIAHAARDEARSREKIQEVGWLLGVQFTVQVVPGPGGEVLHVLAGMTNDVLAGQSAAQQAWSGSVPQTAQLVIAAIDGPASEQTWDNVAPSAGRGGARRIGRRRHCAVYYALRSAGTKLATGGRNEGHAKGACATFSKRRGEDSLAAVALVQALSESRVYLMSQLDEATVEELGITPVASPAELARLATRHKSCILISNAQYAVATVGSE